jgi:hypothetical protein
MKKCSSLEKIDCRELRIKTSVISDIVKVRNLQEIDNDLAEIVDEQND